METNYELIGKEAKLPDGSKVVIEEVEDELVTARRIDGELKGQTIVCSIDQLSC